MVKVQSKNLTMHSTSEADDLDNYNGFDLLDEQIVASVDHDQISLENSSESDDESEIIRNKAFVDQSQWYLLSPFISNFSSKLKGHVLVTDVRVTSNYLRFWQWWCGGMAAAEQSRRRGL